MVLDTPNNLKPAAHTDRLVGSIRTRRWSAKGAPVLLQRALWSQLNSNLPPHNCGSSSTHPQPCTPAYRTGVNQEFPKVMAQPYRELPALSPR